MRGIVLTLLVVLGMAAQSQAQSQHFTRCAIANMDDSDGIWHDERSFKYKTEFEYNVGDGNDIMLYCNGRTKEYGTTEFFEVSTDWEDYTNSHGNSMASCYANTPDGRRVVILVWDDGKRVSVTYIFDTDTGKRYAKLTYFIR